MNASEHTPPPPYWWLDDDTPDEVLDWRDDQDRALVRSGGAHAPPSAGEAVRSQPPVAGQEREEPAGHRLDDARWWSPAPFPPGAGDLVPARW